MILHLNERSNMSSEAAKKAYPDTENEAGSLSRSNAPAQREAFDSGSVAAFRRAAEILERYRRLEESVKAERVTEIAIRGYAMNEFECLRDMFNRMADELEVGQ